MTVNGRVAGTELVRKVFGNQWVCVCEKCWNTFVIEVKDEENYRLRCLIDGKHDLVKIQTDEKVCDDQITAQADLRSQVGSCETA